MSQDTSEILAAANHFLRVFDDLDWERSAPTDTGMLGSSRLRSVIPPGQSRSGPYSSFWKRERASSPTSTRRT